MYVENVHNVITLASQEEVCKRILQDPLHILAHQTNVCTIK